MKIHVIKLTKTVNFTFHGEQRVLDDEEKKNLAFSIVYAGRFDPEAASHDKNNLFLIWVLV